MIETLDAHSIEIKLISVNDEEEVFNNIIKEIKNKKLTYSNVERIMEYVKKYMENNATIK